MTNIGLDRFCDEHGLVLHKAAVGDRYVLEDMRTSEFSLGGEQSGHIIFLDHNTTGDGLLTALKLVELIMEDGVLLSEKQAHVLVPAGPGQCPRTHRAQECL